MTQPPQPPGMGAQAAPLPPPPQHPIPPEYRMPPGAVSPGPNAKKHTGWKVAAGALATATVFGLGFLAAQAIPRSGDDASTEAPAAVSEPAPTVDSTTQTQQLCTAYLLARVSTPDQQERSLDVLPIATALRLALLSNPDADPGVRAAITELAETSEGWIAAKENFGPKGLATPPTYDKIRAKDIFTQAATACQVQR